MIIALVVVVVVLSSRWTISVFVHEKFETEAKISLRTDPDLLQFKLFGQTLSPTF